MQGRMWENQYRTTIVCVDTYDQGEITGRLYNPFLSGGETFRGLMDFIWKMEALLDGMRFPQSFTEDRCFCGRTMKRSEGIVDMDPQRGKAGTFAVRIMFRQNASWQGSLSWLGGRREENFRSALELLKSMDSALCSENEPDGCTCGA